MTEDMKKDMAKKGYSAEEEYFYKKNQELIEKNRARLDTKRAEQASHEDHAAHWLKCPKCGGQMAETELAHIKVEKCEKCEGVYFDKGEIETLLNSDGRKNFLEALKGFFD